MKRRKYVPWLACLWMVPTAFQLNAQQQKPNTVVVRTGMTTSGITSATRGQNGATPKLWQLPKADEQQAQASHVMGNTPTEWLTGAITRDKVQNRPPSPGGDVAYYGNRIPLAGRIILGAGRIAQSHPRIIRVLESLDPGFGSSSGGRQPPRGIRK